MIKEKFFTFLGEIITSSFFFMVTSRILQWGEDRRFDEMRNNLGKLAVFWMFQVLYCMKQKTLILLPIPGWHIEMCLICSFLCQAVWVWTVSLPVTVVNASNRNPSVQARDIIGWIMWSIGITIEATADQQKLIFKNSPVNKGKWCNVGVWRYCRHPNYFGEVSLSILSLELPF